MLIEWLFLCQLKVIYLIFCRTWIALYPIDFSAAGRTVFPETKPGSHLLSNSLSKGFYRFAFFFFLFFFLLLRNWSSYCCLDLEEKGNGSRRADLLIPFSTIEWSRSRGWVGETSQLLKVWVYSMWIWSVYIESWESKWSVLGLCMGVNCSYNVLVLFL